MQDDRTPKLKLPLPHALNHLDEDLPRLREALGMLDTAITADRAEMAAENLMRKMGDADAATALAAESAARESGDHALARALQTEGEARGSADVELDRQLAAEARARAEGDEAEAEARVGGDEAGARALADHDASASAHDALVRRITVGDISPIIGVCQVATGNTSGLWYNVDADGQPLTPNRRYFDYHPVFDSLRRVLVDDQIMVELKPFWFKSFTPSSGPFVGKPCRIISPGQADGFRPYPAFLNTAGSVVPIYIGAFSATDEGSGKAGSRPGKYPQVSLDFPTMRTRCMNRNTGGVTGFRMWDIYHYSALTHLFLIEHCTPEAQGLYGRGWVDSSSAVTVDDERQPNWRGFTGLWGNVWQMVDGFRLDTARKIELFKNDGSLAYVTTGKVVPAYDGSNVAYMVTNHEGKGEGWDMGDGYFPSTSSTSRSVGTFTDYFYGGSGAGNVLYVGGAWNYGSGAGLFCWHLNGPAGDAGAGIGCRLAKS